MQNPTYLCYLTDWGRSGRRSGSCLASLPCSCASRCQMWVACQKRQTSYLFPGFCLYGLWCLVMMMEDSTKEAWLAYKKILVLLGKPG